MDLFRIFDCLNWVENMRVAIDAVCRDRQARRRRDLLHRRHSRSRPGEIFAPLLCRPGQGTGAGRLPYPRPQGHGRPAEARRGAGAGQGAERGGRPADPSPHPRHVGDFGRDGAGRGRCGRGRDRRRDGRDVRRHLAALPRLAGRGLASHRPRYRTRSRSDPPHQLLLGGGARPIRRLRNRYEVRRLGGLSARDAGRPVHQSQGAGAVSGARSALARGRQGLSRRQRHVRRHRQGHAVFQSRRRHGADDGVARVGTGDVLDPEARYRLPDLGRRNAARRSWPAAGRLAGCVADKGSQGRSAVDGAAGVAVGGRRFRSATIRDREAAGQARQRSGARLLPDVSESLHRLRPCGAQIWARFGAADARVLLRNAGRRRGEPGRSKRARRSLSGFRRSAKPTRKGRSASSSNSTASPGSSRCPTGQRRRHCRRAARRRTETSRISPRRCRAPSRRSP